MASTPTHRPLEDPAAARPVVLPGGQRRLDLRNLLFMSVDRRAAALTAARRALRDISKNASGACASSTSPTSGSEHLGRCDRRGSHTQRWCRRTRPPCYGSGTGGVRPGESAGLLGAIPRLIRIRPFSIEVIEVPLGAPRRGGSSIALAFLPTRRPARSPACFPVAITPGTRAPHHHHATHHRVSGIGLAAGACSGNAS